MKTWTCQRDGACCERPGAIVLRVEEWRALHGRTPLRTVVLDRSREANGWVTLRTGPCPFFDRETRACTIYDVRPTVCRRFQCGRWDVTREPFRDDPMPVIRRDNDLRWTYRRNLGAVSAWAQAHGWAV